MLSKDQDRTLGYIEALGAQVFVPSRFTIRVKLLIIFSVIITLALGIVNVTANYLFQENSSILIQEYNLSLARLMGKKIETELQDISYRVTLLSEKMKAGNQNPKLLDEFFSSNPNFIGITSVESSVRGVFPKEFHFNSKFSQDTTINQEKLMKFNERFFMECIPAIQGLQIIKNVSSEFSFPILTFCFPVKNPNAKEVMIAYYFSESLISAFTSSKQTDIFELFLVDNKGNLLLHSESKKVVEGGNLTSNPIVKKLLTSPIDNGSQKYLFEKEEYLGSFYLSSIGGIGVVSNVPTKNAFEAIYRINRQNLLILGIVLIITFLVIFFFARTLSNPIVNLVNATRQIESGNFKLKIKPTSSDEIGLLTNSFGKMAKGLWEKEKIKGAFGKFVNPEIVKIAMKDEVTLGGEHKICTVFFSDIRNFTSMSETRRPEEVVDLLNEYFTKMVECVHSTSGIVDKFIGDAVMAHWGSITKLENDSLQAVLCSLKMREELIALNKHFKETGKPEIRIGCGINTGPVIAGQIGSNERLEFTVIGDAVNLASRIEYLNKHFGTDILISESAFVNVKDYFDCVEMPAVEVKGKEKAQIVYAVLGKKTDPNRPKDLNELRKRVGIKFDVWEAEISIENSADSMDETELKKLK
ncbi:MAG: adenylate/guanylate cyclase domain-containing protein [Leptospiraceae bacterium]|nr:adenylate/guanylate cyclase domain-containing protein [Leptospiraceae bacterium]